MGCQEIAQGLGHLLIVDVEHGIVHPVVGKGLACLAFGLGDFIGMVGKFQVCPATVNIDGISQNLGRHD